MALRAVSLCSGVGGLDYGLEAGFAAAGVVEVRPVLYVEREVYAAEVLAERMAQRLIPEAPISVSYTHLTLPTICSV